MVSQRFVDKLKMGKIGERCIIAWLQKCGIDVLPIEKNTKGIGGPVIWQAVCGPLTTPDMLTFGPGGRFGWIEVKTKSAFSWHRISEKWLTGIDIHFYKRYIEVAGLSTWPIYILFFQLSGQAKDSPLGCPTGLFGGDLEILQCVEHHRSEKWGKSGMVYWSVNALKKFAELDEMEAVLNETEGESVIVDGVGIVSL